MDLALTGRVALVPAASKGLGRATATQLAAEGARVMISSRGEEELAKTAGEIAEATGAQVEYCAADVSDGAAVARLIEETQRDRKSTRLNSSHANISYAVFCLKKKKT